MVDISEAHWECLTAADFLTVEVYTIKGLVTHYILFFIDIASRTVRVAGITPHPGNSWMMQIARNAPRKRGISECVVARVSFWPIGSQTRLFVLFSHGNFGKSRVEGSSPPWHNTLGCPYNAAVARPFSDRPLITDTPTVPRALTWWHPRAYGP
jgi:hypothetical protein